MGLVHPSAGLVGSLLTSGGGTDLVGFGAVEAPGAVWVLPPPLVFVGVAGWDGWLGLDADPDGEAAGLLSGLSGIGLPSLTSRQ